VVLQIFSFYVFENSIFFFFVDQRFRVCCRFHQFLSSIRYYFVVLLILRGSSVNSMEEDDDVVLKKLGYEKVLHRGLNAFSNFAFGFCRFSVVYFLLWLWLTNRRSCNYNLGVYNCFCNEYCVCI
jgi:hypothetical protein